MFSRLLTLARRRPRQSSWMSTAPLWRFKSQDHQGKNSGVSHLRHQNHHLKTSPVSWVLKSPSTLLSFETKKICWGIMSTSEFATLPLLLLICLEHLRTSNIFSKKCPQRWQKLKSLQSKHLEASIFFWSLDGILNLKFETSTLFLQKCSPKKHFKPFQ